MSGWVGWWWLGEEERDGKGCIRHSPMGAQCLDQQGGPLS